MTIKKSTTKSPKPSHIEHHIRGTKKSSLSFNDWSPHINEASLICNIVRMNSRDHHAIHIWTSNMKWFWMPASTNLMPFFHFLSFCDIQWWCKNAKICEPNVDSKTFSDISYLICFFLFIFDLTKCYNSVPTTNQNNTMSNILPPY